MQRAPSRYPVTILMVATAGEDTPVTLVPAAPDTIARAAKHLVGGGLVIFPTETFYALSCDPRRADAVMRLFAVKRREPGRALPLVAGAREQVGLAAPAWERFADAVRLADAFWPGPLSLVLDGSAGLADFVAATDGSIAIRWSPHPVAAALALAVGFPIVATSANRSGARACRYAQEALDSVGHADAEILALDGGPTVGGLPSTLVDVRGGTLAMVRAGAVDEGQLRRALSR